MMKTICRVLVQACLLLSVASCTKDNFIDTGVSKGRFDGNVLEYMEAHPYDWSMCLEMIHHAGADMETLFEGKDVNHPEITFLGITNHSIRRYLLTKKVEKVTDLDAEWCREILLQHIIDGKVYRRDIPKGEPGQYETIGEGGVLLETLGETKVWMYIVKTEDDDQVENGAKTIGLIFERSGRGFFVGSGDLEPDDAVVHALEYKFTLGDEEK